MANQVVSHQRWLEARRELLAAEKAFTHQRDELTRRRMAMPWERVEKTYRFDGPGGETTLADLFEGRSQLIIYHFMLGPGWQEGCKSCSFWADTFDGLPVHLNHRDVTFTLISRAPYVEIEAYRKRMGWQLPWISSYGSDFNFDYQVSFTPEQLAEGDSCYNYEVEQVDSSEMPGISVFYRNDDGKVFHTYSCYGRGIDAVNATYQLLDLAPRGRDEDDLDFTMAWVRRHDEY